uniref:Putative neuropeptide F-like receptor n=1 Tax=Schistosoma mansoni TaxID=6183 RepID=A0A3Q0KM14_SCHMA
MNDSSHYDEMFINQSMGVEIESSSTVMTLIVAVIYPLIIIFSTVGNSIVILTVTRSTAMRTITNLFISNLAASDLLMSFVAAPVTPIVFHMKNWKLPTFLCKLLPVTMGVSVYVSTLTSTAIAADRYLVIVHPFRTRMSQSICGLIIAGVWLISVLISLPLGIYTKIGIDPRNNEPSCMESWPHSLSRPIYTVITFILQFVAPCLIISICYYRVSCVLRSRGSTKIGCGRKSREKEELEIKRNRRTNQMLIAMVIIFVVCWIPLNVLWIVVDIIGEKAEGSVYFHHTFILCHMIAMSSAVYNPFLYAWLNNNFRQEFKAIFQCNNKFCTNNSSFITTRPQTQSKVISRYTCNNNNNNNKAKNDHMDCDNEENINNQLKMHKSINKPKGQHTSYMTIADGDGGVWQGPVCSEIK